MINHKGEVEKRDFSGTWVVYKDESNFAKKFYGKNTIGICPITSRGIYYEVLFTGTHDECLENYKKGAQNERS